MACAAGFALAACGGRAAYPPSLAGLPNEPSVRSVAAAPRLIFHDEFDGTSLNTTIWYRCYNWADENVGCKTGPHELAEEAALEHSVAGGILAVHPPGEIH